YELQGRQHRQMLAVLEIARRHAHQVTRIAKPGRELRADEAGTAEHADVEALRRHGPSIEPHQRAERASAQCKEISAAESAGSYSHGALRAPAYSRPSRVRGVAADSSPCR